MIDKLFKIFEYPVCDNCLGRQFGHLLSGFTNKERGSALRTMTAMQIDSKPKNVDLSNFHDFKFHNSEITPKKRMECFLCKDFFLNMEKWVKKIIKECKKIEFKTFHVGTIISPEIIEREEDFWEKVGIDYCEPLKAEINREIGKQINIGEYSKDPEVVFLIDMENNKILTKLNPMMVYGEYQKLVRGIPQTKWPNSDYKTSVEEIIAKSFMQKSKGTGHKFHGAGREDIDARCLGWRPFVLEILQPKKRNFKLPSSFTSKVKVRKMKYATNEDIRKVKEAKYDKTYKSIISCENKIDKKLIKKINSIKEVNQRTPNRVSHRRSDKIRKRKIKSIKAKIVSNKKFELIIRGEAGLYIKELISGDEGRTKPNISDILENKCVSKYLDVIKIHN